MGVGAAGRTQARQASLVLSGQGPGRRRKVSTVFRCEAGTLTDFDKHRRSSVLPGFSEIAAVFIDHFIHAFVNETAPQQR